MTQQQSRPAEIKVHMELDAPAMQFAAHIGATLPQVPIVSVVDHSGMNLGIDKTHLVNGMNVFTKNYVLPFWNQSAQFIDVDEIAQGSWGFVILKNGQQKGILGYHELTAEGLPITYVFAEDTLRYGELIEVTSTHEAVEMTVNPLIDQLVIRPDGFQIAKETADAVEAQTFKMTEFDMTVTNFVLPDWFGIKSTGKYDFMGLLTAPFQLAKGGYIPKRNPQTGEWTQEFGSTIGMASYKHELHSRVPRLAMGHANWKPSAQSTMPAVFRLGTRNQVQGTSVEDKSMGEVKDSAGNPVKTNEGQVAGQNPPPLEGSEGQEMKAEPTKVGSGELQSALAMKLPWDTIRTDFPKVAPALVELGEGLLEHGFSIAAVTDLIQFTTKMVQFAKTQQQKMGFTGQVGQSVGLIGFFLPLLLGKGLDFLEANFPVLKPLVDKYRDQIISGIQNIISMANTQP